jgi:zinc protease
MLGRMCGVGAKRAAAATICFLAACIASPASFPPTSANVHYPISQATLASGMRAVFEVAPDFGTGGMVLVVGSGSAEEASEKAGLAHLVEHLVFDARHGEMSLKNRLLALGVGSYNGMTTWDETIYFAFAPEPNLPGLAELFADLLDDPLASIDEVAFEHERQVVRDEMRSRAENGTPNQAIGLLAAEVFPAGHPYAHPVVGSEESLAHLTLADARTFAKDHYRPERSVLAMSSPTSLEEQRGLLAKVESAHTWPGAEPRVLQRRQGDLLPSRLAPSAALVSRELPVATPALWVGWPIPARNTADADAALVVARMVEAVFLNHVYDHDRDIAYVHAGVSFGGAASLFYVEATLKEGSDPQSSADSLVRTMLRGLGDEVYQATPFEYFKRNVAAGLVASEEPIVSRTLHLGTSLAETGLPTYDRLRAGRLTVLTSGEVADFYHRYLVADRSRVVLIRPMSREGRASEKGGSEAAGVQSAESGPVPSLSDTQSWMRAPGIANARRGRLPNGLEVVVLPRPGSPFHSVVLAFHGGRADEGTLGAGMASLWAKQSMSYVPPGGSGVEYWDRVGTDVTTQTLRATGSDLALTLRELQKENTYRVFWPPVQFLSRVEAYEKQDKSADAVFNRRLLATFYGTHPYGRTTTSAELRAVRPKDVYSFLDAIRRPDHGLIVVVGDVDPGIAMDLVAQSLGNEGGGTGPTSGNIATAPTFERAAAVAGGRLVVQDRRGADDVLMAFMCALPQVDSEASGTAWVFDEAVRGIFNGALRERAAASYDVSGNTELLRGGTAVFTLRADVDEAHLSWAVRALRGFVEQPARAFLGAEGLARARGAAARQFNLAFGTTGELARRIVSVWNLGWPLETLDRYPERVQNVELADVTRFVEHCQANWVLGLLGNEARIRAALGGYSP